MVDDTQLGRMTFAANGPVSAMNGPEAGWTVAHGRAGSGCPCSAWSGSTNNACTTVIDLREAGGDYDVAALRIRGEHMLPRLRDTVIRAHELGVLIVTGGDTSSGPNSLTRSAMSRCATAALKRCVCVHLK